MLADAVSNARSRCFHRFISQMRIACRGLDLGVTEELPDHGKALAEGQGPGRKRVTKVTDARVVEPGSRTDAAPGANDRSLRSGPISHRDEKSRDPTQITVTTAAGAKMLPYVETA